MSEFTKTATDSNFELEVLNSSKPVLVDFWAEWCGPCRTIIPIIDELSQESNNNFDVYKINVDENTLVPQRFGVRGIPTLIIFKDGKEQERHVGAATTKEKLLTLLNKYV